MAKMQYLDGTTGNDAMFDVPIEQRRDHVARCLGCNPHHPVGWPLEIIDRLIDLRAAEGKPKFYREIGRMLTPDVR